MARKAPAPKAAPKPPPPIDMKAVAVIVSGRLGVPGSEILESEAHLQAMMAFCTRKGWVATVQSPYKGEKAWHLGILTGHAGWLAELNESPSQGLAICIWKAVAQQIQRDSEKAAAAQRRQKKELSDVRE